MLPNSVHKFSAKEALMKPRLYYCKKDWKKKKLTWPQSAQYRGFKELICLKITNAHC